ncbi:MAG: molybdenum cofactor guanylyltransferase [Candidatus Korarchaeum sp.]|nr:molybdenum cofactor guanylyltransferase [Candidatus Korarchaeum sp.]
MRYGSVVGTMDEQLTVLVLAGGYSERFGGNKALYEVNGKSLISYVLDRVKCLSRNVIISAKSGYEDIARLFPYAEVVVDSFELKAPIVGLISSLKKVKTEYVAIVTCDSPLINPEVIRVLYSLARGRSGAAPSWPDGKLEPLQAVYSTKELLEKVQDCWERGDLRVRCAIESMRNLILVPIEVLKEVDPELESFMHLNYKEDLEDFLKKLNR